MESASCLSKGSKPGDDRLPLLVRDVGKLFNKVLLDLDSRQAETGYRGK